jgi:glycosyltransferase involved in cell wall biosynthesis
MQINFTPEISIITSTLNAERFLQKTIDSVKEILNNKIEWIIVDGNSTDGTLNIIKQNRELFSQIIVGNDIGIYDAWNKGVKKARGDWLCFVGAGDALMKNFFIDYETLLSKSEDSNLIYSLVEVVSSSGKKLKLLGDTKFERQEFIRQMTIPHVGTLHSSKLFEKHGLFNTSFRSSGDYEFLLRCGEDIKPIFLNTITAKMLYGGTSESIVGLKETLRIHKGYLSVLSRYSIFIVGFVKLYVRKILYLL